MKISRTPLVQSTLSPANVGLTIESVRERDRQGDLAAVALLTEPTRRSLYEFVVSRGDFVGRDEAAREVGVTRGLAAFHLDRLADAGLLETRFARLSGRRGPGAGRTAKLYRRSKQDFDASVPARDYALPARILSDVVESASAVRDEAIAHAHDVGVELGAAARRQAGSPRSRAGLRDALERTLEQQGFDPEPEPEQSPGTLLRNCPFDRLAKEHTQLMCGMNHALVRGLLEGLRVDDVEAVLDPAPDRCCVRLARASTGTHAGPS
jgi:predicted ArsR family transcriptional regulator